MGKGREGLFGRLLPRRDVPDSELYGYILLTLVDRVACLGFVLFAAVFAVAGNWMLAGVHLAGAVLPAVCLALVPQRRYGLATGLTCLAVLACSAVVALAAGVGSLAVLNHFTVLLLALVLPFGRRRSAAAWAALALVVLCACLLLGDARPPLYDLGMAGAVLKALNVAVLAAAILVLVPMQTRARAFVEAFTSQQVADAQTRVYRDALTGLHNRRYADVYLHELADKPLAGEYCVALGDIDDFAQINTRYGHDLGDVVLKDVAELMVGNTRKTDMVFRFGGGSFLLVIQAPVASATVLLEKLRWMIQNHLVESGQHRFSVSATFGVAPLDCNDARGSLERCQAKLEAGKRGGKNVVVN